MPEDMGAFSKKIEELRKKLAKNPSSRLFLQLAEEYRRSGNPEEAIAVLEEGLKHHPNYTAAKVCLGKALVDLNRLSKAKEILEEVVKIVPENLVANRALADIYYIQGNMEAALSRYEIIQMYNPADEEMTARIEEIKKSLEVSVPGKEAYEPLGIVEEDQKKKEEEEVVPPPAQGEIGEEMFFPVEKGFEVTQEPPLVSEEEMDKPSMTEAVSPPDTGLSKLEDLSKPPRGEEAIPEIELDFTKTEDGLPELEASLGVKMVSPSPPEERISPTPEVEGAGEKAERESVTFGEVEDELLTPTMAELYEKQGMLDKAIEIYNKLLDKYPNSRELKGRIARLKAMMEGENGQTQAIQVEEGVREEVILKPRLESELTPDKGKKEKINTLNRWLEAIKKIRG
jgi:tetratricopeptide (TPR) repeat protein